MVEASIMIPTYNRKSMLEKCLKALFDQDYPKDKYEIILIDDGSTDDTKTMMESLSPSCKLKYLRNEERKGIPRARNRGIREARGEYIIFVDSDVVVRPDFIKQHMNYHKKYLDVIVNGELIRVFSFKQTGKKRKSILDFSLSPFDTANVSVARKHLLEVGGFDEDFLASEDLELGYRLKKAGLKCKRNRQALGYHFQRNSPSDLSYLREKEKTRGRCGALYFKKHPCLGVKLAVKGNPLFGLAFIGRWLDENPRGKRLFSRLQKRNIGWLNAALIRLITCHCYLQEYHREMKK